MLTQKEAIRLWVDALRSGEYKQGKEVLHNIKNNTFCCLGVACEVLMQHLDIKKTEGEYGGSPVSLYEYEEVRERNILPASLRAFLGVHDTFHLRLFKMNDQYNKSFMEIADFIEETYLKGKG